MNDNNDAAQQAPLASGRFDGRTVFQELVRQAVQSAARENWPTLVFSDANFHDWPLGERMVVDSLHQWARSGRSFILLAADYGDMVQRHARFVQWRVRWDHIIVCRKADTADPQDVPSALWSPAWFLQRHDPLRCIGITGYEAARRVMLRQTLDEWLGRKSTVGLPASVLGL